MCIFKLVIFIYYSVFTRGYFNIQKIIFAFIRITYSFLILFTIKWLKATKKQTLSCILQEVHFLTPEYKLCILFVLNFIGFVMCRMLHYQFYTWYLFSLILHFCYWFIFLYILLVCNMNESVCVVMSGDKDKK